MLKKKKFKSESVIVHLVLIVLCVICIVPFLLVFMSSITEEKTLLMNGYSFFPEAYSLYSYTYIFTGNGSTILHGYFVSFFITIVGTAASIVMTLLFAYPLSRKDLPARNIFAFFVFFTMLFRGGLVPSYMMWTQIFSIKNSYAALIIPNLLMNAFYIIMMRTYFSSTIPVELIEAAQIDGGTEGKILWKVIAPLSKPMIATLGFMTALGYWNDWMNGLYYVTKDSFYSIQNILNRMLMDIQYLTSAAATQMGNAAELAASLPSTGIRMSVAVVGLIPILVIYPFFQKYLIKGIMIGGVKG